MTEQLDKLTGLGTALTDQINKFLSEGELSFDEQRAMVATSASLALLGIYARETGEEVTLSGFRVQAQVNRDLGMLQQAYITALQNFVHVVEPPPPVVEADEDDEDEDEEGEE